MSEQQTYLTVEEVAKRLRVSRMTVYRMVHSGTIGYVKIGRSFRIIERDFNRWLEEMRG